MNADKTIEQKWNAVLSHCEEVCNPEHRFKGVIVVRGETSFRMYVKDGSPQPRSIFVLYKFRDVELEIVELFYSMLGLAERDAVEAYKQSLQSDLKSMTAIVSSVKKGEQPDYVHISKITELQSRNTALVVALEKIADSYNYPMGYIIAQEALAANTEKGGAND